MNEVYTDLEKPGLGGEKFAIVIDSEWFGDKLTLVIGEDLEFIGEPTRCKDGWTYSFKAISDKALKYFKNKPQCK